MGGPRLTPEQIERARAHYERTANLSEAARSIGVGESTLRSAFARLTIAHNRDAHARACERGIRKGRRALDIAEAVIARTLAGEITDGPGLEPRDLASLATALTKIQGARVATAQREDQRRQARLTRSKTRVDIERGRADTDLIRARIAGTLPPDASADALARSLDDFLAGRAREAQPDGSGEVACDPEPGASEGGGEPGPSRG